MKRRVERDPVDVSVPFLRSPFNYDRDAASLDCSLICDTDLTKQSFKEECDINVIVKRFGVTGQLPQSVRMPTYGDFSQVGDFHSALAAIDEARASFDQMPSAVRERFLNNPGLFVDFCSNPDNLEEARELGLVAVPAPPPAPIRVVVEPGAPTAAPATPPPSSSS